MEKPISALNVVRAGLYMRLSRDDDQAGESGSIQNQRDILRQYAISNQMLIVKEYVDDGWSGTNFNRPGFQEMISDIEKGKINCVITKDLSRLGRNYIEVGKYTEYFFPQKGVRYIAIGDHVDTIQADNDVAPFLNIFNEFHAKQTSKKTRAVFETKFKNGMNCNSVLPYGYKKDADHKGKILIDDEHANVVRLIFDMADNGYGSGMILKKLFEMKIESPGYVLYKTTGLLKETYDDAPEYKKYAWNVQRIRSILKNEYYIGNTVHYRTRTRSFKDRTRIPSKKEDMLIIENTHEPIVSKETFFSVQRKLEMKKRPASEEFVQVFSGLVKCADCGRRMRLECQKYKGKRYRYFACPGRKPLPVKQCTMHYVRYDVLEKYVLDDIKDVLSQFQTDDDAIIRKMVESEQKRKANDSSSLKAKIEKNIKRKAELVKMFSKLYEDWAGGKISEQNFDLMVDKIQKEQSEVDATIEMLSREDIASDEEHNISRFESIVKNIKAPKKLTRELVNALIDRIEIHESDGEKGARNKTQKIEIYYKFVGVIN